MPLPQAGIEMTQVTTNGSTMANVTAGGVAARGKVIAAKDGVVHFAPSGTNYELHLAAPGYSGPTGVLVQGTVRVTARKVWTVPSGGNFVAPIFGPPRTIQGRVRALDERSLVVQAGVPILVELPTDEAGYDLANGPIAVGVMVNVVALPGARFEPAAA
jgi:hypothetical protein